MEKIEIFKEKNESLLLNFLFLYLAKLEKFSEEERGAIIRAIRLFNLSVGYCNTKD